MRCDACSKWLIQRVTDYESGDRIINYASPEGKGRCDVLAVETPSEFGCVQYEPGADHVEVMGSKPGAPWHHSKWGQCPDCHGKGLVPPNDPQIACGRCARTGRVLYYDDGYIGEEQTRRHPKEAVLGPPPPPKCESCNADISLQWRACPYCGHPVKHPDDPVKVNKRLEAMTGQQGEVF
jgi:hypothetical protein